MSSRYWSDLVQSEPFTKKKTQKTFLLEKNSGETILPNKKTQYILF